MRRSPPAALCRWQTCKIRIRQFEDSNGRKRNCKETTELHNQQTTHPIRAADESYTRRKASCSERIVYLNCIIKLTLYNYVTD